MISTSTNSDMRKIPALRLSYSKEEKNDITKGVNEILNSGFLTMGEKVTQFERLFAEFVGVKYAVAVNSGTSALEIPMRALNVEGKSIIIPTITFMATPLAALHAGAKVIFADVSRESLSIDPKKIEKNIVIFQQINKKKVNILKIFKNFFLNLRFLFTDFKAIKIKFFYFN